MGVLLQCLNGNERRAVVLLEPAEDRCLELTRAELDRPGGVDARDYERVATLGISGDTSCTDHMVAWRTRHALNLANLAGVAGVSGDSAHPDNMVL